MKLRPPPPPDEWYVTTHPYPLLGDIEKVCRNCGRTFYTPEERRFPAVHTPLYCSRQCQRQYANKKHYELIRQK